MTSLAGTDPRERRPDSTQSAGPPRRVIGVDVLLKFRFSVVMVG